MAGPTPTTKPTLTDSFAPTKVSSTATHTLSNSTPTSEIQKCLTLLDEGKRKVITNETDVIFLLGMTGSGKSTLVKFLATNNDQLLSEEVTEGIGEYVIKDMDKKISSSTVVSNTIFPELYKDPETQIAFIDGPGFSDTRGLAVDIAGAYSVNKVISSLQKISFIVTINYSSVRRGMDRGDFLELLKHLLRLVKNINPYLDSMALVVTKMDNQMIKKDGELILVSDKIILESIAKFLLDFKSSIPNVVHGSIAEDMAKVVDVFLRKKDSAYEKIALFRRPDKAGPLSKIQILQDAKITMKRIIRENVKRVNVNKDDFGITISEESKNKLHDVIAAIRDNIATAIREICKSKMLIYDAKTAESKDIRETHDMLKADFETLRNWLANKSEDMNLQNFLNDLIEASKNMKARFSEEDISQILHQGEYIEFLETINGKNFKLSASFWKMELQPYLNYLNESTTWYKFLIVWHNVLSSYSVQKKKHDFAHFLDHRVTDLYDEQFVKLLTFCKTLTGELDRFQSVLMDSAKVDLFNKLLEKTLRSDTNSTYDEKTKTLVIRGKFVELSEHVNTQKSLSKAHFINVFAADKLFIDVSFTRLGDNLQTLYLAAPIVEVIGAVHIKLDGEKGSKAQYRAQDGDQYSKGGRNGRPGAPGQPAANFIGLVNTFINGEHLKITANGGDGGAGQDGGNGVDGYDGDSPITQYSWGCSGNNYDRFASSKLGGFFRGVFCIYGNSGGNGGNGGNGGIGGYGGNPGKIVIPLKHPDLIIQTETNEGAAGAPGSGGKGGKGGKAGRSWNHQTLLGEWREASCSRSARLADEYGDCANTDYLRNGRQGFGGSAGTNLFGAQRAGYTILVDSGAIAQEYRQFLQKESNNDSISQLSKMQFLDKVGNMLESKKEPVFSRHKRMAKLPGQRFKKLGLVDNDRPKWIRNNYLQDSQWPITEKIGYSQSTSDLALTSVPFTDLLMLTDLLVRKLNRTKPNYFELCTVDDVAVTRCAIHILSIFEKISANVRGQDGGPIDVDIDPVVMIEKLEKEIRNGSPQNITKILLDSFDYETSEHREELSRQLIAELQLASD